jgi:hypothetical protein
VADYPYDTVPNKAWVWGDGGWQGLKFFFDGGVLLGTYWVIFPFFGSFSHFFRVLTGSKKEVKWS